MVEVRRNELPKKLLDIRVYDKDVGRSDDFIGELLCFESLFLIGQCGFKIVGGSLHLLDWVIIEGCFLDTHIL